MVAVVVFDVMGIEEVVVVGDEGADKGASCF